MKFKKRLDPELLTSAGRFYERSMAEFCVPALKPRKLHHAYQRKLLGASHHVTLAVHGAGSIRASFHNLRVYLPPLPHHPNQFVLEHSYAAPKL